MYQKDYQVKVHKFINENNFATLRNDPTKTFVKELRNTINGCQGIITKEEKWKYIYLNPAAPTIRGLIKIHKLNAPIRPIVNWKQAPAYKIAKLLVKKLIQHIPLPNIFNVKNSPLTQTFNSFPLISLTCIPIYLSMNSSTSPTPYE
jgi:hypothetical protein